jgi:hypothetical protein
VFKRLLRWRLRRKHIDPQLVDFLAFSELRALAELVKPTLRTYVTPEMVEEALVNELKPEKRGNSN